MPKLPTMIDRSWPAFRALQLQARRDKSLTPCEQKQVACGLYRIGLELADGSPGLPYRLRVNPSRVRLSSAADLLVDYVDLEMTSLRYAEATRAGYFWVLRRFLWYVGDMHPEVSRLSEIQPQHFALYAIHQQKPLGTMKALKQAWNGFIVYVKARGADVPLGARWKSVQPRSRILTVYREAFAFIHALDVVAGTESLNPFVRILARLLILAAPSLRELQGARVVVHGEEYPSLQSGSSIEFPDVVGTRGRVTNYRKSAAETLQIELCGDKHYRPLYAAVDQARQHLLRQTPCPYLFVTSRQRIAPEEPICLGTINALLREVGRAMNASSFDLVVIRNTVAYLIALDPEALPICVVSGVTGRSYHFATAQLATADFDPVFGRMKCPKKCW
jgi:hypothetical protein